MASPGLLGLGWGFWPVIVVHCLLSFETNHPECLWDQQAVLKELELTALSSYMQYYSKTIIADCLIKLLDVGLQTGSICH